VVWPGDETNRVVEEKDMFNYHINKSAISSEPQHQLEHTSRRDSHQNQRFNNNSNSKFSRSTGPFKRKLNSTEEQGDEPAKQAPKPKRHRYFSVENVKLVNSSKEKRPRFDLEDEEASQKDDAVQESEKFKQRRDYLFKKLFESRNLPDPTRPNTSEHGKEPATDANNNAQAKPSSSANLLDADAASVAKPARAHAFQDDFIPLFATEPKKSSAQEGHTKHVEIDLYKDDDYDEEEEEEREDAEQHAKEDIDEDIVDLGQARRAPRAYDPKAGTLDSYRGPYPVRCLLRVRQYLIDCMKPNSALLNNSNYTDRISEILKLKLNIKSKFEDDKRLLRRIKRDTEQSKTIIFDRMECIQRKQRSFGQKQPSNSHFRFEKKNSAKKNAQNISVIELDDTESDGESDVVKMIGEQATFLNDKAESDSSNTENGNDDDQDDQDDSKYAQFGKYSKTSEKTKKKNTANTKLCHLRKKQKKKSPNTAASRNRQDAECGSDSNRLESDDELEELESRYKEIRNGRNKLLRKKKGVEINAQRQVMSNELKQIRRDMKKLRRRRRKSEFKSSSQTFKPRRSKHTSNDFGEADFIPLANARNSKNRSSKKKQTRSNKIKTNRYFKA
jgi:hypothetical protein